MSSSGETVKHDSLAEALVAAQAEFPPVERDQENPHFKSRFVSLGNLLSKTRPVLNKHGIALAQLPAKSETGESVLLTRLLHCSGESMEASMPILVSKNDAQGFGSALTYAKRYALAALLAIADQDDDAGNAAASEKQKQSKPKAPPPPPKRQKPATVGALVEDLQRVGWKAADVLRWLKAELGVVKHPAHKNVSDVLATLSDVQANALMSEIQRRADAPDAEAEPGE